MADNSSNNTTDKYTVRNVNQKYKGNNTTKHNANIIKDGKAQSIVENYSNLEQLIYHNTDRTHLKKKHNAYTKKSNGYTHHSNQCIVGIQLVSNVSYLNSEGIKFPSRFIGNRDNRDKYEVGKHYEMLSRMS